MVPRVLRNNNAFCMKWESKYLVDCTVPPAPTEASIQPLKVPSEDDSCADDFYASRSVL